MLEFLKAPFLVLHFSFYTLMTFLMMLSKTLLSMLMMLLYSKCDQASDLWQQFEFASELESDLRDTVDWGRKRLVDFNAGKTRLVLFDRSCNTVILMWKWMGLFLRKNDFLRYWAWFSLLNWIGVLTLSLLLTLPSRKLEPWFILWSSFLLRLLSVSL